MEQDLTEDPRPGGAKPVAAQYSQRALKRNLF
jgi:hypothetical protein